LITDIEEADAKVNIQFEGNKVLAISSSRIDSFKVNNASWDVELIFSDRSKINFPYLGSVESVEISTQIDPYIKEELAVTFNVVSPVKHKIVFSMDNKGGEELIVETSINNIHSISLKGLKENYTNIVDIEIFSPSGFKRFSLTAEIETGELPSSKAPLIEIVYDIASSDYNYNRPVVFAGDSMVHVMNWNYLFRKVYPNDEFPIIFNRGIGGNKSTELLSRFESNVLELKPSSIFIEIGTNDLIRVNPDNRSAVEEKLIANYIKMIELSLNSSDDLLVHILSILPVLGTDYRNIVEQSINEKLQLIALDNGRLFYIDCFTAFYDAETNQTRSELMIGPITAHINDLGYEKWASIIYPFITKGQK
tara:strand:+ start:3368 stop:4462 length:1095 start_codon:yes stop_codon:yes gene_type:complete